MGRSTCVEGAGSLAGRECDRLKLDRLVLFFSLHQKTKPFLPRSPIIVALMFSSSPGVRLLPLLQMITRIFFSAKEKTNWKLDSILLTLNKINSIYPRMFL